MKIKKEKMFKSKHLFIAHFSTKTGDFFCIDGKIPIFCPNIFQVKNVISFGDFAPKNWKGWSDNVETFHKENSGVFEKKNLDNKNFITAAVHCEN